MKKLFTKAFEWLRRRVTALKDTRSVYANANVNDDNNDCDNVNRSVKSEALQGSSLNSQPSSISNTNHDPLLLRIEEFIGDIDLG